MKGTGIQIGNDYDILVEGGSTAIGDVQPQNQALIIISNPGEWKQYPETGVGIEGLLLDDNPGGLVSEVKRQLKADGFTVDLARIEDGQLLVDAAY